MYSSISQHRDYYAGQHCPSAAVILDVTSEVGLLYGARATPRMYSIDKTRQLVHLGGIDSIPGSNDADITGAKNDVHAALDAIAAGKAIENSGPIGVR